MSRDRSLDFDNEVYPVGFVSDLGIFIISLKVFRKICECDKNTASNCS